MADQVNQVQPAQGAEGSGFGSGMLVGLLILVVLVILFFVFGGFSLFSGAVDEPAGAELNVPSEVDVNLEGGAGAGIEQPTQ